MDNRGFIQPISPYIPKHTDSVLQSILVPHQAKPLMVAMEFLSQSLLEENSKPDAEELEETLSFCDLPIYSNAAQDQTSFSSSSESESDHFEFFSGDWKATAATCPAQSVVFCGKFIPYKQPVSISVSDSPKTKAKTEAKSQPKTRKQPVFQSSSDPLKSSRSRAPLPKKYKGGAGNGGFSPQRVPLLTSPAKFRWFLFVFGLARFPTEMELGRDARSRRPSRRVGSPLYQSGGGDARAARDGRSGGKGLWRMVRALGCSGDDLATPVVEAPFGSPSGQWV